MDFIVIKPNTIPQIKAKGICPRLPCIKPKVNAEIKIANVSPNFLNFPRIIPLKANSSTIAGITDTLKINKIFSSRVLDESSVSIKVEKPNIDILALNKMHRKLAITVVEKPNKISATALDDLFF